MTSAILSNLPVVPFVHDASWAQIILGSLGGLVVLLGGAYFYLWHIREWTLPYRNVPGPKPGHWFFGSLGPIIKAPPNEVHGKWIEEYGPTYRYRILLGGHRFFTADPVALNYILTHSDVFGKPMQVRKSMADMLGNGVLVAEGADHRRQRRVLNPSFSPAAIRDMVPIFFDKAYELRDKLLGLIDDESATDTAPSPPTDADREQGGKKIDVMKYLGMTTIDVIGIAGFNYDFEALRQPKNELAEAFREMFSVGQSLTIVAVLQALVPGLGWIPTKRVRTIKKSQATTQRIGRRLIEEKKRAVLAAHGSGLEKGTEIGKDLLSLCIKANMGSDLRPDQKMTDDEMLGQITTFMLAGNETSSTALTWLLWQLALHPDVQDKLREECNSLEDEKPTLEQLNGLHYMDACIREILRLLPPAPSTIREASQDVVIPLGTPIKGRDGQLMSEIKLSKGTTCFLPIMAVNHNTEIWGADAAEFNPSRFAALSSDPNKTELANQVPGVWGNMLTFLGGTRNCIGYRFALAEIKSILFVLIRNFTFEELASKPVIEKKSAIVMRSRVVGEEKAGPQMPLCVKPISA